MQIRQKQWQQVLCCSGSISCVFLNTKHLGGSEFSGGSVTGQLLNMTAIGWFLFIFALLLTFFFPRVAAAGALLASLLCLPLCLYFVAPGPFRWVFRGEYSVPLTSNFVWANWPVAGIVAFAVTTWVCFQSYFDPNQKPHNAP
jgi:hypothetical protein